MTLDFNEIRQLLVTIAQTDIAEVTLKNNEFELTVRKAISFSNNGQGIVSGVVSAGVTQLVSTTSPEMVINKVVDNSIIQPAVSPSPINQKLVDVLSPMVGTFYRAPAPGEAPFVEVGDRVKSSQSVCIIEAMKLMNEIEAEVSGQVMEILVQNGEPVEYGQPLMRINPD
ncbi:acetyl-CoA carboxylase biotin carboxyl carrier protein [Dolichospermum circinale CS-1225]|uniref:Biotin carboxyl carrier protein of acetyl-CoA carboxylase n=1 Tax=Dolichospermum circinale CS-537/01 TaxID=3021739 RepID=A0ABT5A2Z3_9CYAN|nr:acetyl-CoA carboxylase biotin carboxyl carrier protein [Dolichospermum circinale]MDB9459852.1 acetyl-CoA carboxylase biotin carboxyl carrier protein [Dolichospermum circinale CS-545/17]MDB9468705.1 acetyl-CoA carboxylase biotin carboxyl carrier protein [Dolichospermum circinale CS-539/09]MDB9469522.1 acetyl-CoA carboxylase biotin carboxyl carrier protein [Dolichospermum circinale CS-539]MDB9486303.1 acetyl-CoA carboxylase biotin carboxyl carrier protein [Dolichospermum circinale CS-537/01]M